MISPTQFHFSEIKGDLSEPRSLTDSLGLKLCHVSLFAYHGINVET